MHRYFVQLNFRGTNYHGWQMQDNAISVQQVLASSLSLICREDVELTGCGRTDAGVHASMFFAHFDLSRKLGETILKNLPHKLNSFLPVDIAVQKVFGVSPDIHARFSAIARTYQYRITREKNPFLEFLAYYYPLPLDVDLMNRAAELLLDYRDFSCFSRSHTQTKTNDCRIVKAIWEEKDNTLVFTITADRFLRNMVRAICGTLIDIGRHKKTVADLGEIILSGKRSNAGKSMPAHGLFLTNVEYEPGIISGK